MFETTRRHIFLAGFMGTGKSAVGRAVASKLDWSFIDLDEFIESMCHRSIPELFRIEGETAFRNYESRALRLTVISPHSVIALGGGTPLRQGNANIIRATGRTWHLTASWEAIWDRVRAHIGGRPVLADLIRISGVREPTLREFIAFARPILDSREVVYRQIAGHTVDTSDATVDQLARMIVEDILS